jgi:hypothetical protein
LAIRWWGCRPEVLEEEMGQVAGRGEDKGVAGGDDGDEGTGRRGGSMIISTPANLAFFFGFLLSALPPLRTNTNTPLLPSP